MAGHPVASRRPPPPPAPAPQSGPAPRRRRGAGGLLIVFLFALPGAALFLPTTLLVMVGLVPTLVALIVDRDAEKFAAITVGPVNFCGVLPAALALWQGAHSVDRAMTILAEPAYWLVMYGAAAAGWLIYFSVPPAVGAYLAHRNEVEIERLTEHQERLVEEWGPEVAAQALGTGGAGQRDPLTDTAAPAPATSNGLL